MYKADDLKHSRSYTSWELLPFIVVGLFSDIVELFYKNLFMLWDNYIGTALVFSWIWFGAMWINNNKQQKALEKERLMRQFEEERNNIIAARKEELEIMVNQRTAELTLQKEDLEKALADLSATQT